MKISLAVQGKIIFSPFIEKMHLKKIIVCCSMFVYAVNMSPWEHSKYSRVQLTNACFAFIRLWRMCYFSGQACWIKISKFPLWGAIHNKMIESASLFTPCCSSKWTPWTSSLHVVADMILFLMHPYWIKLNRNVFQGFLVCTTG